MAERIPVRRLSIEPVLDGPTIVVTAAEAACPNPSCVDGRVGQAGCAVCGGATVEELRWRVREESGVASGRKSPGEQP